MVTAFSATRTGFFKWLRRVITARLHWLGGAPFGLVTSAIANRPEIPAFLKLESFEPGHRFFRNFRTAPALATLRIGWYISPMRVLVTGVIRMATQNNPMENRK